MPRAQLRLDAAYEDAHRQIFLVARDISELGVFLLSPDLPPVGAEAQVTLELPSDPEILRLRGVVVRQRTREPTGFVLRFDGDAVGEALRRRVRDYVASRVQRTRSIGENDASHKW